VFFPPSGYVDLGIPLDGEALSLRVFNAILFSPRKRVLFTADRGRAACAGTAPLPSPRANVLDSKRRVPPPDEAARLIYLRA
jgi:hypothetical protein